MLGSITLLGGSFYYIFNTTNLSILSINDNGKYIYQKGLGEKPLLIKNIS
jgi:hypothetical protein